MVGMRGFWVDLTVFCILCLLVLSGEVWCCDIYSSRMIENLFHLKT